MKFRRRHYFINRSVQSRYMCMVALLILIISVLTGWRVYSSMWNLLAPSLEREPHLDRILIETSRVIFWETSIVIFIGMCISALITMFITHRVTGPMFRLKRTVARMGEGELPKQINFREKDELKEIAESINSLINRLESVKINNELAISTVNKLLDEGGDSARVKEEIEKIEIFGEPKQEAK